MMMIWFTNVLIFALITKNVKAVEMTSLENLPNVPLNDLINDNEMRRLNELRQSTAKLYRDFIAKLTSTEGIGRGEVLEAFALDQLNVAPQIKTVDDYCKNLKGLYRSLTISDAYRESTFLSPEEDIIFNQEFTPAQWKLFGKMHDLYNEVSRAHGLCAKDFYTPDLLHAVYHHG